MKSDGNGIIVLKAVGDIALFKSIQNKIKINGNHFIFEKIRKIMNEADLIFGNFEFSCSNVDQPKLFNSRHSFIVDTSVLPSLLSIDFTVLNLANNHIMDWGKEGLITTKGSLEKLGIKCFGVGKNLNEARRPVVIDKRGIKVGFLGYTKNGTASDSLAGAPLIELPIILEDITKLKEEVDHIIVSLHWGVELSDYPHPRDVELGHKIIDAGARVVLGHHPHVVQSIEEYNRGIIFYSLGSFLFDPVEVYDPYRHKMTRKYTDKEVESIIAEIRFAKEKITTHSIIPTKVTEEKQVILLEGEKKDNCISRINTKSVALKHGNMFYKQDALTTVIKIQIIAMVNLIKRNPGKALLQIISKLKIRHIEIIFRFVYSKFSLSSGIKFFKVSDMVRKKPIVLIGSLTKENTGPITTITRAFMEDLSDNYAFIPHFANRKFGHGRVGKFNIINIYYFFKHVCLWIIKLIKYRPNIAHYPFTSFWNIEKSLIFLMIAKLFSHKVVAHLHGGAFDVFWLNLNPIRKKIALQALYRLDAMIVLSDGWKKWICKNIGLDEEKVMVVNNPIDRQFQNRAISFKRAENNNMFFIGSLGKRKGVYDILALADLLKKKDINSLISIAGREEYNGDLKKIKKIVSQKQLNNVKIIGPLYGSEKIEYFKQNSIFLFPSYNENFPLVVIEAAAAGKAIVTTRVGALPEFFEHEKSVLFVEPGNVGQIASAVIELINDKEKKHSLEIAARETFVVKLSRDKIIQSLHYVYQSFLTI